MLLMLPALGEVKPPEGDDEQKAAFLIHGGCDMVHADPEYDMGVTGAMKIAHLCEALGLDVQMHACGPAHRAVVAAHPGERMVESPSPMRYADFAVLLFWLTFEGLA